MSLIIADVYKRVVRHPIQEDGTFACLASKYSVSKAIAFNWVRAYRKEFQTKDNAIFKRKLIQGVRRLRQ